MVIWTYSVQVLNIYSDFKSNHAIQKVKPLFRRVHLSQKLPVTFTISICLSECISAALTGQISKKLETEDFNEKSVKQFQITVFFDR
jgi:hypothetical protein